MNKDSMRTYAEIDLDALHENMQAMQRNLPEGKQLCCVVKANAYGHGAPVIAHETDAYAAMYAVATLGEAVALRSAHIAKPILILGPVLPEAYHDAVRNFITLTVFDAVSAEKLNETANELGTEAHVHVAVDTGMGRIGVTPDAEGVQILSQIAALPNVCVDGVFTHFAKADQRDEKRTKEQLAVFAKFQTLAKEAGITVPLWHCGNSAAILRGIGAEFDMLRAGISMYGYYPSEEIERDRVGLRPVMSLRSHLTYVKTVPAGTEISYGGLFKTKEPMRIGTVCCGYADGYPRGLSGNGAFVSVHGKRCRLLGRVCMDQLMIDLSEAPQAKAGDLVTLFGTDGGQHISLERLAKQCGGFHYELMCNVSARVPRIYKKGNDYFMAE